MGRPSLVQQQSWPLTAPLARVGTPGYRHSDRDTWTDWGCKGHPGSGSVPRSTGTAGSSQATHLILPGGDTSGCVVPGGSPTGVSLPHASRRGFHTTHLPGVLADTLWAHKSPEPLLGHCPCCIHSRHLMGRLWITCPHRAGVRSKSGWVLSQPSWGFQGLSMART